MNRMITIAVVALLLPGLALAIPIAGSCGLCGDGDVCHMQQAERPATESHSCCETESETPPEPSFGTSACTCGRETPPALAADAPLTVDTVADATSFLEKTPPESPAGVKTSHSGRPPAPPPSPPAFLIDCAFLT
jgi:hypothetical protein